MEEKAKEMDKSSQKRTPKSETRLSTKGLKVDRGKFEEIVKTLLRAEPMKREDVKPEKKKPEKLIPPPK